MTRIKEAIVKHRRERVGFVTSAIVTMVVGLVVYRQGTALSPLVRDFLGDALWALMIAWFVGALAPRSHVAVRWGVALTVCWVVEFSQLIHTPTLDGWRSTVIGHLVLGSDFAATDLAAYAAGVTVAILLEQMVRRHGN